MAAPNPNLKLIRSTQHGVDVPDDPAFPYRLDVNLRPPEFMRMAFIVLHGGSEEIVIRGMTLEDLEPLIAENDFRNSSRLRSMVITGPEGIVEQLPAPKDKSESATSAAT